MNLDIILKGGIVVEPHQATVCDIAVKDGKIVQIATEILSQDVPTVDLKGKSFYLVQSMPMFTLTNRETSSGKGLKLALECLLRVGQQCILICP